MKHKIPAALLALAVSVGLGLAGCSSGDKAATTGGDTTTGTGAAAGGDAPAPGDEGAAGFTEYPIGDPQSLPPLEVAAVYFQPVDMEPAGMGLAAADSDLHIEADISAGQNDLGYGVGDFVPNLTVEYTIATEDGTVASAGTFMPMNASDGPHYGANIAMPGAGTYKVTFTIHSPEETGTVLHVDKETGVEGRFWAEPIVAQWDWDYTPREW
ncbi:MAG: iron transporter [Bifidobacteriaceae bacterium]|jgi:uncharacterized protein involved in high-affinity Fe2+ transport|nr:iron transporter [Bifidobacteriaceae bacterium]